VLVGHDDWRLPSKIELESILDDSKTLPAIDPTAFPETPWSAFWSSSTFRTAASARAYTVVFTNGSVIDDPWTTPHHVRCVRSDRNASRTPQERYVIDAAEGTVRDTRTRLTWARVVPAASLTWDAARVECESRRGAWRVPTRKELLTIVDTAHFNPAIDWNAFPDAPSEVCYWSSTLAARDEDGPSRGYWTVLATDGNSHPLDPRGTPVPVLGIETYVVRCVHD
jgi:hypothetical protein